MTAVLERSELQASPLADLHAIADQIGLDGFRRLRKADLIDAILDRAGGEDASSADSATAKDAERSSASGSGERESGAARRRRPSRSRRTKASEEESALGESATSSGEEGAGNEDERDGAAAREEDSGADAPRRRTRGTRRPRTASTDAGERGAGTRGRSRAGAESTTRSGGRLRDSASAGERSEGGEARAERVVEGVVELLGNGSAFLRVSPPDASDEDAYISAAQVRRCELVSGDRVSGPVRTPRHSERYPSLARVDTINGSPADTVAEGSRYEDLPASYPVQRLELDAEDPTLGAIEWLTPIGRGSRALIVGAARAGKTETLRRLHAALAGRDGLEVMVVLSGVRPEEIAAWSQGSSVAQGSSATPAAALSFAASAELQGQTVEHVVETARRIAARGGDVVVLIDSLDGLHPHAARKILANARNLAEGGSLTLIATATRPFGGESTVIALDVALTSTGHFPALDLAASGTVRPELLVGEDGAAAITRARAAALGG
jgi:transcription termination factor Rho